VNKIPPNFDTFLATYLQVVWLFKGLSVQRIYKAFGVKGLKSGIIADLQPLRYHVAWPYLSG
jgi:hypothetical protein